MKITFSKFTVMAIFTLALGLIITSCAGSEAIRSAPSVDAVSGLKNKLTWLKSNAVSGGSYVLEISSWEDITNLNPFSISGNGDLSYKDRSNITIILRSTNFGTGQTIQGGNGTSGSTIFEVGSGVTLILDSNIILKGHSLREDRHFGSLVRVSSGGTLVMNDGSAITGGHTGNNGGGVYVHDGGTFIMKGGNIYGNISFPRAVMAPGAQGRPTAVANNTPMYGGGVYVNNKGTFTKTGGTIAGYTGNKETDNVVINSSGNVVHNSGHAVYAGGKRKETTAGPDVNLHFSNGEFSGGWDE